MKKIFTLIAMALMAVSANAQNYMISYQALHRTLHDSANGEAFSLCSLCQLLRIAVSHGAHKVDWQIRTLVRHNVATEELAEVIDDQLTEQRIINVLSYI